MGSNRWRSECLLYTLRQLTWCVAVESVEEGESLREDESLEELDTQSQWSDEGSMTSEFELHDTDRHEIVEGWVNDQANDDRQEKTYPYHVVKRSFHFVEPTLEEVCGDWLI